MTIEVPAGPASRPTSEIALAALRGPNAARIPDGLVVQGEGMYPCDLAVDGNVQGSLMLPAGTTLLITEHGAAAGTLQAGDAFVEGCVTGTIDCSNGAVEFASSARCTARVLYRELSIARGAEVEAELQNVGVRHG